MRQLIGDVPLGGSPSPPIADHALLSDCETCALAVIHVIRADHAVAGA